MTAEDGEREKKVKEEEKVRRSKEKKDPRTEALIYCILRDEADRNEKRKRKRGLLGG